MDKCRICNNSFESVVSLNNHVKYSHPNQNQPIEDDSIFIPVLVLEEGILVGNVVDNTNEELPTVDDPINTDTNEVESGGGNSDGGGATSDF